MLPPSKNNAAHIISWNNGVGRQLSTHKTGWNNSSWYSSQILELPKESGKNNSMSRCCEWRYDISVSSTGIQWPAVMNYYPFGITQRGSGWVSCLSLLWEHFSLPYSLLWDGGLRSFFVHFWEPSQRLPAASETILTYGIVLLLLPKRIWGFCFRLSDKKCALSREHEYPFHQNMFLSSVRAFFEPCGSFIFSAAW